jgi:pheromone a factor receptor
MVRRAQFGQLISSNSSFSVSQYFRLMGLASCEIIFTVSISTRALYLNVTSKPIYRWISWSDTHFGWNHVETFPAHLWRSNYTTVASLELNRWEIILCAMVFFGFFGFAEEARKHYRIAWAFAANHSRPKPASTQKFQCVTPFLRDQFCDLTVCL